MSWEPFEHWPDGSQGGSAFRGATEPVLAKRERTSLSEWLCLTWHSGPDLQAGRVMARAMVTEQHGYVQRRDGSKERVSRQALRGVRQHGPVIVVGVREAEHVFLLDRPRCAVQAALLASAGRQGEQRWSKLAAGVIVLAIGLVVGSGLFADYGLANGLRHLHMGLYTSETLLGLYAGVASYLIALLGLLWIPDGASGQAPGRERVSP